MSCPNLSIPQIKKAVDTIGFSETASILEKNFDDDYIPSYEEILSYRIPSVMREEYNKQSVKIISRIAKRLSAKHNLEVTFNPKLNVLGKVNMDGTISLNPNMANMDTPFHEFSHPLINLLEKENKIAYNALKRSALKDKDLVQAIDEIYPDYSDKAKEKEIMAQHLGIESAKAIKNKKNNLFTKIWEFISDILSTVLNNRIDVTSLTTMGDLVNLLVTNKKLDLSDYVSEEFQRNPNEQFSDIVQRANDLQKETLLSMNKIINANFKVNETINKYISSKYPSKKLDRATEILQKDEDIKYEGPATDTLSLSQDWGNILDYAFGEFFTGKDYLETIKEINILNTEGKINVQVLKKVYEWVQDYKSKNPESLFIAQLVPFNLSKNIAGSSDITEITKDGEVIIWDIKSMQNTTSGDIKRISKNGNEYVWNYNKSFKDKKSLKQKHEAQISLYSGLYKSKGVRVDGMGIIPIYIKEVNGNEVLDIEIEDTFDTMSDTFNESYKHVLEGANDENFTKDQQITEEEDKDARKLHDKVLLLLEEEKKYLKNKGGRFSEARIKRLENIQNEIKTVKSVKALEKSIDSLFTMFVSYTNSKGEEKDANFTREVKEIFHKIQIGKITDNFEILKYLEAIQQRVSLYSETMNDIRKFFLLHKKNLDKNIEKNSSFDKIRKILDAFEEAEIMVSKTVKPTIAKILAKMENSESTETIQNHVAFLTNRMNKKIEKERLKFKKKKQNTRSPIEQNNLEIQEDQTIGRIREKYQSDINNYLQSLAQEDNLLALLEKGYNGIEVTDSMITPIAHLSNPLTNTFYKTLKKEYAKVRDNMQRWGVKSNRLIRKADKKSGILKNSQKTNDELITEVNGVLYLISDIDHQKFLDERKKAFDEIDRKYTDKQVQITMKKRWNAANKEEIPYEDEILIDPYTQEELVLRKGISTLLREKKEELEKEYGSRENKFYKKAYSEWLKSVSDLDPVTQKRVFTGRQFTIPKKNLYKNPKFDALYTKNKEYYDAVLATFARGYLNYGVLNSSQAVYRLPAVPKGTTDRLTENGILNFFKHFVDSNFKNAVNLQHEDAEIYGSNAFGLENKTIPKLYHNANIPASDISRDLLASAGVFLQASERFVVQTKIEPLGNSLLREMKNAKEINLTADGRKKILKKAQELGLNLEKYEKKYKNNYTAMSLEAFIDAEIYGIRQHKETITAFGKEVNAGKLANFLAAMMSMTSIAAKPLVAIANGLQQNVMLMMEGIAGEYVNLKSYKNALLKYNSYEKQFIQDMIDGNPNSFIGQLVSLYDPYIGHFKDHFGRKLSNTGAKRLMQSSTLYYGMHKADHQIYVTSMIALMMDKKIKNSKTGQEVPLLEAYELVDGILELKKGFKLENGRIDIELKDKMDAMNQRLHGVYNELDKPRAEKYATARLIMMFRKFVPTGVKKRFKKAGIDHNTGTVTEGFYRTFLKMTIRETKELLNFVMFKENELSPHERANVKRFLFEIGMIQLLAVIVGILGNIYDDLDDDDDKRRMGYLMYFSFRLRSELRFYSSWGDFGRIIRTPTVTYSQIMRVQKFISQIIEDPMEEFKVSHSIWEKGDNKSWAYFLKIFGYNGYTTHPQQAYENLKLFTNSVN